MSEAIGGKAAVVITIGGKAARDVVMTTGRYG